jgi:hypothetical protein
MHVPVRPLVPVIAGLGILVTVAAARLAASEAPRHEAFSPEQLAFFESEVRPLLIEKCVKCHGEEKQKGGLRLDHWAAIEQGGDSGPPVTPGDAAQSLLIEAVRYESYEMPPDGKLADEQIAILTRWVDAGAPWPAESAETARAALSPITDEDRGFWSFQAPRDWPVPAVSVGDARIENEIDRFILARLHDAGLSPSPTADRLTLARRVYQAVVGLPPTPGQLDAFLSDESADAYDRLVDELLSSTRYGEHWARYWLDLVRYAESDGYKADGYRPHAWRYRDYVVRAFNEDKPYDQFVREQLAGDELAPDDPEVLAATGYLRHGIYEYNQRDAVTQWRDMLNDITDTTGDVFLAMGMGCARCHDHKFDPILQVDYYRLQAFFAGLSLRDDVPLASRADVETYEQQLRLWERETAEVRDQLAALEAPRMNELERSAITKFPEDVQAIMAKPAASRSSHEAQIAALVWRQVEEEQAKLDTKFKGEDKDRWTELKSRLEGFAELRPQPLPQGQTVTDIGPMAPAVFIPGKERLGEVAPGFLSVLDPSEATIAPIPTAPNSTGRRTALAQWITRPDHPLTARVIVNRVWQQHFGKGLVATPSDFGRLGEAPSHPELLDWLAVRFVEQGWSIKWLQRLILTSATFQQSSHTALTPLTRKVDPANRLLWRQNIRRLQAEQIRDAFLAAAGELQLSSGGGPPEDFEDSRRRSIYTKMLRNQRDPLLDVFDLPDRITGTGERNVTTSPTQSLLMINGDWTLARAEAFATRLRREVAGGDDSLIRQAYRIAYGRDPDEKELDRAVRFCVRGAGPDGADSDQSLHDFCHVLLNASEFLYID